MTAATLPTDSSARKAIPLASGCLDYFPDALAAVAAVSSAGNRQHHPDKPLHWDRSKSRDHADALLRHLIERGTVDGDGHAHSAKVAWRALALLQEEIEASRTPPPVGNESEHPLALAARRVAKQATTVAKPDTVGVCAPSAKFDPRDYWRVGAEGHHPMMAETLRDTRLHGPEPRL
ncbi:MAG: hypothetical protein KGL35_25945 [Bradyrhizobium sp.]|nr:hypothetical protein [Bradyrhizobium sp.]